MPYICEYPLTMKNFMLMTSITLTFYSKKLPTTNNIFISWSSLSFKSIISYWGIKFSPHRQTPIIRVDRVNGLSMVSRDRTRDTTVVNPMKFKVFKSKNIRFLSLSDWIMAYFPPPQYLCCLLVVRHMKLSIPEIRYFYLVSIVSYYHKSQWFLHIKLF